MKCPTCGEEMRYVVTDISADYVCDKCGRVERDPDEDCSDLCP